jgi:hypothetical protein
MHMYASFSRLGLDFVSSGGLDFASASGFRLRVDPSCYPLIVGFVLFTTQLMFFVIKAPKTILYFDPMSFVFSEHVLLANSNPDGMLDLTR